MLFSTSLVALVGAGEQPQFSPRRLQIVNTKRQAVICELNFSTSVLNVALNRKRLVVVLEESISVYDISNMKLLHMIDTCSNLKGLCALSPGSSENPSVSQGNNYIAYPANISNGQVLLFDAITLQSVNIIQAHKSSLSALAFNYDGTLLATASETGTVIRIFSIPDGKRLYQLRRGSLSAKITHLSFNMQSNMLCVCSDSDTIHIFKLMSAQSGVIPLSLGEYLPGFVNEMLEPTRDFARIRLSTSSPSSSSLSPQTEKSPTQQPLESSNTNINTASNPSSTISQGHLYSIAAISAVTPHVMVASSDGYFRMYLINLEVGGECKLLKEFEII